MAVYPTGVVHRPVNNYCWDTGTMSWIMETCSGGSGGSGGPIQDGGDPSILATVFDFLNSNPLAVVLVDANGDPVFTTGGGAVTIADGADVAEGTTTDAAITTDSPGTVIGFLRGLVKILSDVWDDVNNRLNVAVTNTVTISDGGGSITVDAVNLDIRDLVFATDKVDVSGSAVTAAVTGTVTANQGTPAATANRWPVQITDGTDLALVTAAGEQNVLATAQPGVDIGDVTINNTAGAGAVNIQDGGNSITVDAVDLDIRNLVFATDKVDVSGSAVAAVVTGTVTANQGTPAVTANRWPVQITDGTDLALVTAAGEVNVFSTAQPGVDIGDVTINNAAGAAAVNIQDGGNSITVDGTVSALGTLTNNAAAPAATNVGVLPALANAASPTWVEGRQVLESVDLTGRQRVRGTLTNNNAAPAADLQGVMNAVATAAAPSLTEGNIALLSEDLAGNLRVTRAKVDLTPSAPTTASVGITSASAVSAAATRKGLILTNVSNATISLGFGQTAVLNSGVTLYPGGTFCMGEFDFDLGAVNAIASEAASGLAIQEYLT